MISTSFISLQTRQGQYIILLPLYNSPTSQPLTVMYSVAEPPHSIFKLATFQ